MIKVVPTNNAVDISNCAEEPIHIPGMIQPHGLLLVFDETGFVINQVSENSEALVHLAPDELVDRPLEDLLGFAQTSHLRMILRGNDLIRGNPIRLRLPDASYGQEFNVLVHKVDQEFVFEAELIQIVDRGAVQTYYQEVRQATARLQATESEESLCQVVADEVRGIIEYDRVMIYRFDADWNGSVIAESRNEQIASSYLGLHFPASDIPEQVRRLYTLKRLGCIPDTRYTPVKLCCSQNALPNRPLDMTQCVLRSVSPMHLEYLYNMGVGATLTVSLLKDGKLWGLIACHNYRPKLVCPERRISCSFLAQIIEAQLKLREEGTELAYRMQTSGIQVRLVDLLARSSSIDGLAGDPDCLLDFVDAQGAVIVYGGKYKLLGQTPPETEIPTLIDLLVNAKDQGIYATNSLAKSWPKAEQFKDVASGMLGVEVSRERGDFLLWFRPEQVRTVNWAGNPDKPISVEIGTSRLHPRKSFELWKNEVTLHSTRWKPREVIAAQDLNKTLRSVMASEEERTSELRKREKELCLERDRAEAANVAKSEFLANMSHEIRTPMTAILGFTDLLANSDDESLTTQQRQEYISTIKRNGEHLLTIIDDILDLSKIEAGKMDVEKIAVSPEQVLLDVDSLMQVKARARGITLRTVVDTPIPQTIQSDPVRLKQILVNLVGNAIKFTENGDVTVHVSLDTTAANRPFLCLKVADAGIGLTPTQLGTLFGAFVQADASTTRKFGGTGLGLRISRSLTRLLGGEITVSSVPGRGTSFTATILTGSLEGVKLVNSFSRFNLASEKVIKGGPTESIRPLDGMRILLAEDGPDNQRLISHYLKKAGANVLIFENGRLALEAMTVTGAIHGALAADPVCDLVLTDMQMPEMDGYAFAGHLRTKGWKGPIVAITAHAMSGDLEKCLAAGCDGYIAKPINGSEMLATMVKYKNHLHIDGQRRRAD